MRTAETAISRCARVAVFLSYLLSCANALAAPVDIFILIDESGSVTSADYAQERNATIGILNSLTFGVNDAAVGIGSFATTARVNTDLSISSQVLTNVLSSMSPLGGNSCLPCAFDLARTRLTSSAQARANAPNLTIMFTDAMNNQQQSSFNTSLAALQSVSTIFVIGIGSVDRSVADAIASDIPGFPTVVDIHHGSTIIDAEINAVITAITPASVAEPSSVALLALALVSLSIVGFGRRKRIVNKNRFARAA